MALTGTQYANLIASYVVHNFGRRGITVYREVYLGKTIIGKNRRLDILILEEGTRVAMGLECKYQDTLGTADEKIPYALSDMEHLDMPVCLVYAGKGWSGGILHMLRASPLAAFCDPPPDTLAPSDATRELDAALARTFRWWDLVVRGKAPFTLPR
jgi:acetyl-CoA carboxylase alpha subunit